MLDLNLDAASPESTQYGGDSYVDRQTSDGSGNRLEESGTSTSSVINADGDDDSCSTRAFTLSFDILKVGSSGGGGGDETLASIDGITKEFFPVAGDCGHLRDVEGSSSRSWIDLSFDSSSRVVGDGETKVVTPAPATAPVPAQVKKSRRGPRSRSSQYRGVTFYRRTGRWESHIW